LVDIVKNIFLCVPFLDIILQFSHPFQRLIFTHLCGFSITEVFVKAWVLPSVTYFFSLPKKVGKKRFWPSLFELLAQAIPENETRPSNSVLPGHPHMA